MRIRSIRLKNLNSLVGDHEVNLELLGEAPIFLVVGPTGAGKSTLMDAVSLALFGQTPRLQAEKSEKRPEIDARNVMSRGTGVAFAQVELTRLEAGAERRYRATWQCHRAHRRPEGDFQSPRRTLELWDSGEWKPQVSSDKPKDYQPEFDRVLEGMSVSDFKRCMLLAQGEFAAFLEAKDDERAAILERLTATSQYLDIGRRAAQRQRDAKRALEAAQAKLEGVTLLDADARAHLEAQVRQAQSEAAQRTSMITRQRSLLDWLQAGSKLRARCDEGYRERDTIEAERAQHAEELAQLERDTQCAPAWSAFVAWRDAAEQTVKGDASLQDCAARRASLEGEVSGLRTTQLQATSELAEARDALRSRLPEIEQARESRRARDAASAELKKAEAKHRDAVRGRDAAATSLAEAKSEHARADADYDVAMRSLAACEPWRPLVERIEAIRERRRALAERRKEFATRERQALSQAAQFERLRDAMGRRAMELESATSPETQAEAAVLTAKRALEVLLAGCQDTRARRDALVQSVHDAAARLGLLKDATRLSSELSALSTKVDVASREAACLTAALEAAAEQAGQLERRSGELAQSRANRATDLEHVRWLRDMARERSRLRHGEQCPLCGSTEHPLIVSGAHQQRDAEVDATCLRLEQEVRELDSLLSQAASEQSSLRDRRVETKARLDASAKQAAEVNAALAATMELWNQVVTGLRIPADSNGSELGQEVAEAERVSDELQREQRLLDDAEQRLAQAEKQRRDAAAKRVEAGHALDRARADLQGADLALSQAREDLQQLQEKVSDLRSSLAAELSEFGIALEDGDESFHAPIKQAERRSASVKEADAAVRAAERRREEARVVLERAIADGEARSRAVAELEAEAASCKTRFEAIDRESAAYLGGAHPEEVFGALERAVAERSAALDSVRGRLSEQTSALAAETARWERAVDEVQAQVARRDALRAAVDSQLQALGLAHDDELGERVLGAERRASLRAFRDDLDKRAQHVASVILERERALQEHSAVQPDGLPEPWPEEASLSETIERLHSEVNDARAREVSLRSQLETDRQRRAQYDVWSAECDQLRADWLVWDRLHDLIGTADGQVFRLFAQSLNLAELIGKANDHLARLAPRYSLVQARDGNKQLRIAFSIRDDWQAGQERPLTTLSGGETFLVSLSLALALAEYNAIQLPIETLLLDEGFGTLDQETLGVVMRTLEALHADGRQVGIITHVEALRERIDARVVVEKLGNGRSTVRLEVGAGR